MSQRYCDCCDKDLGEMSDADWDLFVSTNDGICDVCWLDHDEAVGDFNDDPEAYNGPNDMSDDADALASAGRGTDEDYEHYDIDSAYCDPTCGD